MPVFYFLGAAAAGWLAGMLMRRDRALGARHGQPFEFPEARLRAPLTLRAAQPRELRPMAWRDNRIASAWQPFEW